MNYNNLVEVLNKALLLEFLMDNVLKVEMIIDRDIKILKDQSLTYKIEAILKTHLIESVHKHLFRIVQAIHQRD